MNKKLLTIVLLTASLSTQAVEISLGSWSKHVANRNSGEWNETHQTIGINLNGFEVAYIPNNSFNEESYFAGYNFSKRVNSNFDLGLRVGAVTGYEEHNGMEVTPWLVPNVTGWLGPVGVEFGMLPSFSNRSFNGLIYMYTVKVRF